MDGSSPDSNEISPINPLELNIDKLTLYHGSATPNIEKFHPAIEQTIGNGIYFTSDEKVANGYAQRRAKRPNAGQPIIYEVTIENLRLADLTNDTNVHSIMSGFVEILKKELDQPNLPWYKQEVLQRTINLVENGKIGAKNLRDATFSIPNLFTEYLRSLSFDGLRAIEGGEGEEIKDHDSFVIFDPDKIKIT